MWLQTKKYLFFAYAIDLSHQIKQSWRGALEIAYEKRNRTSDPMMRNEWILRKAVNKSAVGNVNIVAYKSLDTMSDYILSNINGSISTSLQLRKYNRCLPNYDVPLENLLKKLRISRRNAKLTVEYDASKKLDAFVWTQTKLRIMQAELKCKPTASI